MALSSKYTWANLSFSKQTCTDRSSACNQACIWRMQKLRSYTVTKYNTAFRTEKTGNHYLHTHQLKCIKNAHTHTTLLQCTHRTNWVDFRFYFLTTDTLEIPKQIYPAFTQSSPWRLRSMPPPSSPPSLPHLLSLSPSFCFSLSLFLCWFKNPWLLVSSAIYSNWPCLSQSCWWRWREERGEERKSKRDVWMYVCICLPPWQACPRQPPPSKSAVCFNLPCRPRPWAHSLFW